MVEKSVSGLAVTDADDGSLVHNVSFRDIKMWVAGDTEHDGGGGDEEGGGEESREGVGEEGEGKEKDWTDLSIEVM